MYFLVVKNGSCLEYLVTNFSLLFFSKSSTIMRPRVPPPLPPKVGKTVSVVSRIFELVGILVLRI